MTGGWGLRDVKAGLSERNGVQGVVVVVVVGDAVGVVAVAGAIGVVAVADAVFRCSSRRPIAVAYRWGSMTLLVNSIEILLSQSKFQPR
jgi:hypothetical protein